MGKQETLITLVDPGVATLSSGAHLQARKWARRESVFLVSGRPSSHGSPSITVTVGLPFDGDHDVATVRSFPSLSS